MLHGAIFDLDGVIVNTVPLHFKAWKRMFNEYGKSFELSDYLSKVDGRPRYDGAAAILTDLSKEEIVKAGEIKQSYFREFIDTEPIDIFDSSVKLIKEMKEKSIKLAAASSSKNAVRILKKINLYDIFEVNVSGGDFARGKPAPDIFLMAAEKLGLTPTECVVFEDANSGVQAAIAGGFPCIGIDRHNNAAALAGADKIVKDLSEITLDEIRSIVEGKK